ncbi:serine/threonine protein kinase [Microcella putealis]|uniref:non-specific serine/threonine protein kinase n=1 Tax=Microcella putealis TaxID=337005 RepID=A0A4Q7LWT0_9MICO|nr:serine/threonine-protein kinase [Microcella putealis]RZS59151.1 serine/threonine protein kinase [Microcella putealis]TQM24177.1 serine/threonine protein kinase [Microcella putealis]
MVQRRPSVPPVLPGFTHIRLLGTGGFADVFLYEQNMPRRQVAVKVMLADVVTDSVRRMFQAEANLMAQLSSHPGILTVYQASISADGRPYLVMELCGAHLADRFRRETIPVTEVLRIGVQIGSAIETAHRQGVLHRDIKPSNILTTAFGHPVLSDFGIAASLGAAPSVGDTVGMSVPWSAPEVLLDETTGTIGSEVWALGATLYTLLAGRSPFEQPGGQNGTRELIARITRSRLPALDRQDAPASLEAVLRRAMSRDPGRRQQTALELVRDLQRVEAELGLAPTHADIALDDWARAIAGDPADRTVVRAVSPRTPTGRGPRRRRRSPVDTEATVSAGTLGTEARAARHEGHRSRVIAAVLVVVALAVVGLGATATWWAVTGEDGSLPRVTDVEAEVAGEEVTFRWQDPGIAAGDTYRVSVDGQPPAVQRATEFAVVAEPGQQVCVTVRVAREGRTGPASAEKCAMTGGN